MKVMVTGASGGIGSVVSQFCLDEGFQTQTCDWEKPSNITMDLTSEQNRIYLSKLVSDYDVLINCFGAGISIGNTKDKIDTNFLAMGDLVMRCYETMKPDSKIINLTSIKDRYFVGEYHSFTDEEMWYSASKIAFSSLMNMLRDSKRKPIQITDIAPDWVNTTASTSRLKKDDSRLQHQTGKQIYNKVPMEPDIVASTIIDVIKSPSNVTFNRIEIGNRAKDP